MEPLLAQLHSNSKLSMLRNGTWTLSNLCRGKPQPPLELVSPSLATLGQLIFQLDDEVLTDACWALSYLADGPNERIAAVIESGVTMRVVELLMHQSPAVQTPALRTVGNIVTGDDLQTQLAINCSVLPCLLSLLSSVKKGIKKEACWTVSNITAGNKDQIQKVIDANIIPPLIHLLSHAEFDIKKEAAWAISNATSGGTPEQIEYLVERGCIPPLCALLTVQDNKIVTVALEGLENILKVGESAMREKVLPENPTAQHIENCGGLDKIDALQQHEDVGIYEKALKILERYFGAVDDVQSGTAGAAPAAKEENIPEDELCTICCDKRADSLVVPCGHQFACGSCLDELKKRGMPCSICRGNIERVQRVYSSIKKSDDVVPEIVVLMNRRDWSAAGSYLSENPSCTTMEITSSAETPLRIAINNGAPSDFLNQLISSNPSATVVRGTKDQLLPVEFMSSRCEFFKIIPPLLSQSLRLLWESLPIESKTVELGRQVFCSHLGPATFLLDSNDELVTNLSGWQWNEVAQWAQDEGKKEVASLIEAHALAGGNSELRNLKLAQEADSLNAQKQIDAQVASEEAKEQDASNSILPELQGIIKQAIEMGGCTPWRRAKLMVVGQGRAGKSSTIDSLRGRKFEPRKESTVGAQVDDECVVDRRAVQNWEDVDEADVRSSEYKKALNRIAADKLMGKQTMLDQSAAETMQIRNSNNQRIRNSLVEDDVEDVTMDEGKEKSEEKEKDAGEGKDENEGGKETTEKELAEMMSLLAESPGHNSSQAAEQLRDSSSREDGGGSNDFVSPSFRGKIQHADDDAANLVDEGMFNMRQSSMDEEEDDKITFSIWDFGGQRVFYSLHHAFLTRLGCYVVVFRMTDVIMRKNPTAEEHDRFTESWEFLRFWTRSIAMHARHAPVLFVGTHKDMITSEKEFHDISEQLNRFLLPMGVFHDLDVKTNDGGKGMPLLFFPLDNTIGSADPVLASLRAAVDTAVREDTTDYLHHQVPLPWLKLHDELKNSGNPYVHLADVQNLAKECNIPKAEVAPALMFLHELGVLLFYNEPVLREILILDPQWMVDAISRVVRQWGQIHDIAQLHLHPAQREISRYYADEYEVFLETAVLSEPLLKLMIEGQDTRRSSELGSPKAAAGGSPKSVCSPSSPKSNASTAEDESKFKGQFRLVVKLMSKFGLLCDWPSQDDEDDEISPTTGEIIERTRSYFVPSLLPERLSEDVEEDGNILSLRDMKRNEDLTESGAFSLVFDKFIPDGMWERLVCLAVSHAACLGSKVPTVSRKEADMSFGEVEISMVLHLEKNLIHITVYNAKPVTRANHKEGADFTGGEDMPGTLRNILVMMRDMATDIANEFFSKRWAKRINVVVESKPIVMELISAKQATGVIAVRTGGEQKDGGNEGGGKSGEEEKKDDDVGKAFEYDFKLLQRAFQRGDKILWALPIATASSTSSTLRSSSRSIRRKNFFFLFFSQPLFP